MSLELPSHLTCEQLLTLVRRHLQHCRCCVIVQAAGGGSGDGSPSSRTLPLCNDLGASSLSSSTSPSASTTSPAFSALDSLILADELELLLSSESSTAATANREAADSADSATLAILRMLSLSDFAEDDADNDSFAASSSKRRTSSTPVKKRSPLDSSLPVSEASLAEALCSIEGQESLMESVPNQPLL